jgi:hypothetical protein
LLEIEPPQGRYLVRSDAELRVNRLVSPDQAARYISAGERLGSALLSLKAALRNILQRPGSKSPAERERSV